MEVTDVTKCVFFAVTDPELMKVDFTVLDERQKKTREASDKANPPAPTPALVELNKLRHQLFLLQEAVKNTEIYEREQAGRVQLAEEQLAEALRKKKIAAEAGNVIAERNCEHAIHRLESESEVAKQELTAAKKRSAQATRAFRDFDGHARIAELKQQVETPSK